MSPDGRSFRAKEGALRTRPPAACHVKGTFSLALVLPESLLFGSDKVKEEQKKRDIRVLGGCWVTWGGVLLPPIRAPSGLSGALFTSRDTHTLLFIWAGPLTSTAKGFFQGMSGSKLLGGLAGSTDERETRQKAPPLPLPSAGRPQSSASAQLPQPTEAPHPLSVGLAPGQFDP